MPLPKDQVRVPQAAPGLRFERFAPLVERAISKTLQEGVFVGGNSVLNFEAKLAEYLGVGHVISCNSGTDALFLSLLAMGVGPEDEVIVPALTAAGTAVSVTRTAAIPRFADVSLDSRNINVSTISQAMTKKVKAIIVVHLHGTPVDIDPILEFGSAHSIPVIEDCAQAIGAKYRGRSVGSIGQAGAFSFYPTKNLGCLGDGGAVTTDDPELASRIRSIRNYGWNASRLTVRAGTNSRLDALQASVLLSLLPELNSGNAERCSAAQVYDAAFETLELKTPKRVAGSVYHQYALELENPEGLAVRLLEAGFETAAHYRLGLHEEPYFTEITGLSVCLPNTEFLCKRLISLPIQPELTTHQEGVINAVRTYFRL